jgi:hypothetical protein
VRDGGDYLLNGTEYYISGVDEADALIVVTRTAPERLSLFIVPTDAPGLVKHPLPVGISVPEKQFTLHFDSGGYSSRHLDSVIAKTTLVSPDAMRGSHSRRCSSLPWRASSSPEMALDTNNSSRGQPRA